MMLVGMSDPGLIIQPTHRLVRGFVGLTSEALAARLAPEFVITPTGEGEEGCRNAWETIEIGGEQDTLGFGTVEDGRWFTAKLRNTKRMDVAHPRPQPRMAVARREHPPRAGPEGPARQDRRGRLAPTSTRSARCSTAWTARSCDLACLVPPAGMEHVEAIASNLEKMPPKSTYFYPKLLSGLVLNPLR